MRRLNVLPGITGLLQINERIHLNLKLGINMILNILKIGSLFRFKIILKTLRCFIRGNNKGLNKVGRVGIEPTTLSLKGSCSTN